MRSAAAVARVKQGPIVAYLALLRFLLKSDRKFDARHRVLSLRQHPRNRGEGVMNCFGVAVGIGTISIVLGVAASAEPLTYTYSTIDPPGSTYTIANDINDKGQIVGLYYDGNRVEHGFISDNGTYTTIDPPAGVETVAQRINAKGQITGWYQTRNGNGHQFGFLESDGVYMRIPTKPPRRSEMMSPGVPR
jgi:uncharacterized membrane protein